MIKIIKIKIYKNEKYFNKIIQYNDQFLLKQDY